MAAALDELIHRADLDELVRHVDATCDSRDWDHLLRIRNAARAAVDTGRQLWPIATLANYRLALWAPADLAVRALDDTARTFMPGPVSEIIAIHHRWEDLEPHLAYSHDRSLIAYERALRGDEIDTNEPELLDIPIAPQWWELAYTLATYNDDGVVCEPPALPRFSMHVTAVESSEDDAMDDDTIDSFRRMMEPWTAQSNGSALAAVVEGGIEDALGAIGLRSARMTEISHGDALSYLAWAAASGGAFGKRRGIATGRSEAWWLLATFTGLDSPWPCDPEELGEVLESLNFYAFDGGNTHNSGWGVHVVIEDPEEGLSCALSAHDHS